MILPLHPPYSISIVEVDDVFHAFLEWMNNRDRKPNGRRYWRAGVLGWEKAKTQNPTFGSGSS
jgi:hypothetical protein